jgi:hypothetical protein
VDEETAQRIYDCALAFDPILGALEEAVDTIKDEALRRQFKRAVGAVMGAVFSDVMHPLERQFPQLIPAKERPAP